MTCLSASRKASQRGDDTSTCVGVSGQHNTDGARAGSRTLNLGIKSPLLCQLSYASA